MREPDARDAAWVLVLALTGLLLASLLVLGRLPGAVALALMQGSFLAAPLLVARAGRMDPLAASGLVPLRRKQAVLVLMASVASLWLLFGLTKVEIELLRIAGYAKQAEAEKEMIRHSLEIGRDHPLRTLLVFAVVPPICEEMFFRGILFRGIASRFGAGVALVASTLLFSSVHQTLSQKGMMLVVGGFFGLLVHLSGSLWSSILAHAINNTAVIVMVWMFGTGLDDLPIPWWMTAVSALLFGLAMTGLVLERRASPVAA
jgi:membrane protease YdiL (CAAX protease family)